MGTRLSKAPVCYTLVQMRFNPRLDVESSLLPLHKAFREEGFPDFSHDTLQAVELAQKADGMELRQQQASRFIFRNAKQTAAILLDHNALTYELTDYPVFEEVSTVFLRALEITHQHRPIEYFDRLGMRMLDAIQPFHGEHLDKYLVPSALGLAGLIKGPLKHQQTLIESIFTDEGRTLVVRAVRIPQGIAAPPDLSPLRLKLKKRFIEHQGESVMLDCDSSKTERTVGFSREKTQDELERLKSDLSTSFRSLTTDHARTMWA
ncbi:MAG: TIGR04255 family protein [Xanthomonadaceae bacterium]|nr:TIGR04255 family protein [Xanthomonadaceae bacterium]